MIQAAPSISGGAGVPLAADVTVKPSAANASFEPGRGADLAEKYSRQNKRRFRSAAATRSRECVGQHKMEERLRRGSCLPACAWARGRPQASRASAVLCCLCQAEGSGSRDCDLQAASCLTQVPQNTVPASLWSRGQTATEASVCMC